MLHYSSAALDLAIKQSILRHEHSVCSQIFSDSNCKPFWSYVRSRLKTNTQISAIVDDTGASITQDRDIANCFNRYFASNFNLPTEYVCDSEQLLGGNSQNTLECVTFTADEIFQVIQKLPSSTSVDANGICYLLLKHGGFFLSTKLAAFFNILLARRSIPDAWRKIVVTPVHKSGPKNKCSNFRPVAVTSCVCRVMERVLYRALLQFLQSNASLHPSQHGFIPGYSIETAGISFLDLLTRSTDTGNLADAVFLDYSKAFDTVSHTLLLRKLFSYGIAGSLLSWIGDYLRGRSQVVRINNELSDPVSVSSGVFQGSVLGPLFFIIFINDIDSHVSNSVMIKYADDLKLLMTFGKDPVCQARSSAALQNDLNAIAKWSEDNGLSLNVRKCFAMHFGTSNQCNNYFLNDSQVERVSCVKDLGISLSDSLKFNDHILGQVVKANRMLGLLKRSFYTREPRFMLIVYKAFVRSLLEYGCILWSPGTKHLTICLEKVQKRFCRFFRQIKGLDYRSKLLNLGLLSLESRRLRYRLIFLFKMLNGDCKLDPNNFFISSLRATHHFSCNKLLVPYSKHLYRCNFFTVDVVQHWNKMSFSERNVKSVSNFKKSVSFYFERCNIW